MLRGLLVLAAVLGAAASGVWLAGQPGAVRYDLFGHAGRLSTGEAFLVLLAGLGVAAGALEGLRALFGLPRRLSERNAERRRARTKAAQSDGLVAVAAGDRRAADKAATEAVRLAPDEPLTRLLAAQSAQLSARSAAAHAHFSAMTADPRTATLGLRGLHVEALRAGDAEAAREHARAAAASDPALPWAVAAAFDAACAARDFPEAMALLDKAGRQPLIDRATYRRRKAVLLVAEATEQAADDPETARRKAVEAHGLAKDLVAAAILAARLVAPKGRRQAASILEETWRVAPHPSVFSAALTASAGESAAERLKRAEALAALKPGHVESALGVAAAARAAREFDRARAALRPFAEERPSKRVCVAMAELEAAESGDEGRVREWLARAVRAPHDPAWVADGVVAAEWAPISPVTGRLDAFEWRVPDAADHPGPQVDLAALMPNRLAKPMDPGAVPQEKGSHGSQRADPAG